MSELKCKCNYHLGMGPNLLCPVHGKREDLSRRIQTLEKENVELREQCKGLAQSAMNNGEDLLRHEFLVESLQSRLEETEAALRDLFRRANRTQREAWLLISPEHRATIERLQEQSDNR